MEKKDCPKCGSENTYPDQHLLVCGDCFYEWNPEQLNQSKFDSNSKEIGELMEAGGDVVKDANGNLLVDGDAVIVLKDLKIKGSTSVVKGGTKIKGIRIVDAGDGHNITCKIEKLGSINLKSEFVKKA